MINNFGSGINEWVKKLKIINPRLGDNLFEDSKHKERNVEKLKELGLPFFETKVFKLGKFLENRHKLLSEFRYDRYFVSLIHKNGDREREIGVGEKEISQWIDKKILNLDINADKILVSECPEQPYNGVLIIEDKENFYLEMIKGKMPDLISKNYLPEYVVYKNSLEISTKFLIKKGLSYVEMENQELKSNIWGVIKKTGFLSGYYEFSLAKINKKNTLTPFFYEYINKDEYRLR